MADDDDWGEEAAAPPKSATAAARRSSSKSSRPSASNAGGGSAAGGAAVAVAAAAEEDAPNPYAAFVLMENLHDKLKLLNYDARFCQAKQMPPIGRYEAEDKGTALAVDCRRRLLCEKERCYC